LPSVTNDSGASSTTRVPSAQCSSSLSLAHLDNKADGDHVTGLHQCAAARLKTRRIRPTGVRPGDREPVPPSMEGPHCYRYLNSKGREGRVRAIDREASVGSQVALSSPLTSLLLRVE
jgi:hypothetical protein